MPSESVPEFAVRIRERFSLEPWHEATLAAAIQAHERWQSIRKRIDREGELVPGRYKGVDRAHPLMGAEVSARSAFLGALRELNLDDG